MRVRETWHAFCYPESNQRNSLSINHLGAPRARKCLSLNDLGVPRARKCLSLNNLQHGRLGTLLEYLATRLGTLPDWRATWPGMVIE